MAKLPNADKAIIPREKLCSYLLSSGHPNGKFKAAFFYKFGYTSSNWETFEKDLRKLVRTQEAFVSETNEYGTKYTVDGPIKSPSGETIQIFTVWFILKGKESPHLVTAYSGGK